MSERCGMKNVYSLLQVKSESDHNKREAEKMNEKADFLKQEIQQMKKERIEKDPSIDDKKENEWMISGSSLSQPNQDQPIPPHFDTENPFFEICGLLISLRGFNHPESVTIQHSLPEGLGHFDNLRKEGMDFDKKIFIGDFTINVHKDLLSARISYFKNLFGSNWKESASGNINLSCDFDPTIIEILINWAYNGILSINLDNVQCLMRAASYLLVDSVSDECYQFKRKRIEYDGALPLLNYCKSIGYNKTGESLMKFIDQNFVPISFTADFLDLSIEDLINIIKRETLNVDRNTQVFDAVAKWIGKDENRKNLIPRLLKSVGCHHIPSSFLTDIVEKNKWIMDIPKCIDMINESQEIASNSLTSLKTLPIIGDNAHNLIFATSLNNDYERNNNDLSRVEIFDPLKNKWHRGEIECRKLRVDNAVIGNKIYFMGQFFNEETDDYDEGTMIIFDTTKCQFNELTIPSQVQRYNGGTGVIDGKFYSVGGDNIDVDSTRILSSFDPSNPSAGWTRLADMGRNRESHAICVMKGKFFVIGGYDKVNERSVRDGEYYDPTTDKWTPIAEMPESRITSGAGSLGGEIYIVGGSRCHGGTILASMYKYSPETNTWKKMKSMKYARSDPTVIPSCGMLFVCGGTTSMTTRGTNVFQVERYDPSTDTWTLMASMSESRNAWMLICAIPVPASFPTPNVECPITETADH